MARHFALKFISGKYAGGEFPLLNDREIVVGRASEVDMVLVEDMVSRKHAKFATVGGQIVLQDLGSTNGTFVNGEKIAKKVLLKENDRVLIGTSILKLIAANEPDHQDEHRAKRDMQEVDRAPRAAGKSDLTGNLDEVPVPDLLQLFGTSKRTGVLVVESEGQQGKIYLRTGGVFYACIDEDHEMGPMKAFCRIVGWTDGGFDFREGPDEEAEFMLELEETTEDLLASANRENEAMRDLRRDLPPMRSRLRLPRPLEAPLAALGPLELDVIQLVHNTGSVAGVLDRCPATDSEAATALLNLMAQGYIKSA